MIAHIEPQGSTPDPIVRDALALAHGLGYVALILFLGGLAFLALIWPAGASDRRTRALLTISWLGGVLATLATAGLEGAYASLGSLGDAFTLDAFRAVLETDTGVALAAQALLWVLATVVLATVLQSGERAARSPGWRVGAAVVGFGLLRTTGMHGHNSEGSYPALGAIADLFHLLGISLWVGGLVLLTVAVVPRRRPAELAAVVPAFSALAAVSVAVIVATGVVLAWQVVGSFDDLTQTSYGRLLLIKAGLVAAVLLAAQCSRLWVRRRLVPAAAAAPAVRPFVYSLAAETVLILAVLAVTSVLVTSTPGR